jgi:hypothetical protein
MLYSIHEDDRTFQPKQDPIAADSQAILVFARREFLDVTREATLQGIESLADIPPQRFWQGAELLAGFLADEEAIAGTGFGSASAVGLTRLVRHRSRPLGPQWHFIRFHANAGAFILRANLQTGFGPADFELVHADTERAHEQLINPQLTYVSVSSGRYDSEICTNEAEKLGEQLSRNVSNQSALEIDHEMGVHTKAT